MSTRKGSIGIDIGGTKMAVAVVDAQGRILARQTLPTEAERGFPRAVERLEAAIRQLLTGCGWQVEHLYGIGVGCAGPVDPVAGLINNPYTLEGWDRCDIISPLRDRFGMPAFLENDADAAALGECFAGAGREADPVVMLTFGTGIGGGVIMGGEVYRGVNGEHPELGHIPCRSDGPKCYCGTAGCLESIASGTALGEAGRGLGYPSAREVFQAANSGDAVAKAILDKALDATATAVWTILHTFLPQRIIFGGGIIEEHFELFAAAAAQRVATSTMAPRDRIKIVRAELGNDAGLVGAARLASCRQG